MAYLWKTLHPVWLVSLATVYIHEDSRIQGAIQGAVLYNFYLSYFYYLFIYYLLFFGCAYGMWNFHGQGLNLCNRAAQPLRVTMLDLQPASATREVPIFPILMKSYNSTFLCLSFPPERFIGKKK